MSASVAIAAELEDIRLLKVTDEIREAARRLLTRHLAGDVRKLLEAIADGKRKRIDWDWWCKVYGDPEGDAARAKLAKITAMADPARNANEHERRVAASKLEAASKLASAKAFRPPGMGPEPEPLPTDLSGWVKKPRKRKTKTAPPPAPKGYVCNLGTVR
jgi:hypothetical protein